MILRKNLLTSLIFVIFLFFFIWFLFQLLAPLMLSTGSVSDLSGVVGITDNDYIVQDMPVPWNVVYSIGDRLCHQKSERSLFLNNNEMPFCTRCTAIWLGLAIGLGCMVLFTFELNVKFLIAIVLGLLPIGVDGFGQMLGFWESTNLVRILTGLPAGLICGIAVGFIYDEFRDMHFFHRFYLFQ